MSAPLDGLCRRLGIHHPTFAVTILQVGSCMIGTVFQDLCGGESKVVDPSSIVVTALELRKRLVGGAWSAMALKRRLVSGGPTFGEFYYVKVFLNHYKIDENWFQAAQVLYMVWNAVNDPLFGMFQDLGGGWMRSRTRVILYSGPFFAASFLVFWFPWGGPGSPSWVVGAHLIVALFLYDGVFSFALLAWCALFTEITTDHASRVRAMKYMQVSILIGVNSIFIVEKASASLTNFPAFQATCVAISVVGWLCFHYTGRYASSRVAQVERRVESRDSLLDDDEKPQRETWADAVRVSRQVLAAKDFQRITAANFLHVVRSTCHLNFAAIFTEGLISRSILPLGSIQISAFYGACALLPQILVITYSGLVNRFGSYRILQTSFAVSACLGLAAFVLGRDYPWIVLLYMLLDSIAVHTFSPLIMLLFADFIDDDMERHERSAPLSSVVFSLNALFTKPAQSLAPMLAVFLLNRAHYEAYNDKKLVAGSKEMHDLQDTMFSLLTLTPVILGALEWVVFRSYTLRDKHRHTEDGAIAIANI